LTFAKPEKAYQTKIYPCNETRNAEYTPAMKQKTAKYTPAMKQKTVKYAPAMKQIFIFVAII
jgi:hypothetical protein